MAYKTTFVPKNKEKYIGDCSKIKCRSLWERNVCSFCDEHSSITKWSFEEIAIPYLSPVDKKIKNYYPDFLIEFITNSQKKVWLIEVKPKKQTYLKENASKNEKYTWAINQAKWMAAERFCKQNNIEFKILTEKDLFTNGKR